MKAEGLEGRSLASPINFQVAADMSTLNSSDLNSLEGADVLRSGIVKVKFFNSLPKGLFEFRVFTAGKPFLES